MVSVVSTSVEMGKTGRNCLYPTVFAVNIISFTSGIAFGWTSPVIPKLQGVEDNPLSHPITTSEESWIASILSLGVALGPFLCGPLAERIGKKKTLLAFAVPVVGGFVAKAFASEVWQLCLARFVLGLGFGDVFAVVPMYVAEIAQDHNRGLLCGLMPVFLCLGLLFSYGAGPYVSVRVFSLMAAAPAAIFLGLFAWVAPESPYYLVAKNDHLEAERSLRRLRGASVKGELSEVIRTVEGVSSERQSFGAILRSRALKNGLVIVVGLLFFQQFSGINVILSYMQSIFEATGSSIPADISTVVIGAVTLLTNLLTSTIVDRSGRRILLLISASGACLSQLSQAVFFYLKDNQGRDVEAIFWLPIASLVLYTVTYNLGLSSLGWTIMGEIFPQNAKAIASACCTFSCLFLAFATTVAFPHLVDLVGMAGAFAFFSAMCAVALVFVAFAVPETKGKSLREIQAMLNGK